MCIPFVGSTSHHGGHTSQSTTVQPPRIAPLRHIHAFSAFVRTNQRHIPRLSPCTAEVGTRCVRPILRSDWFAPTVEDHTSVALLSPPLTPPRTHVSEDTCPRGLRIPRRSAPANGWCGAPRHTWAYGTGRSDAGLCGDCVSPPLPRTVRGRAMRNGRGGTQRCRRSDRRLEKEFETTLPRVRPRRCVRRRGTTPSPSPSSKSPRAKVHVLRRESKSEGVWETRTDM